MTSNIFGDVNEEECKKIPGFIPEAKIKNSHGFGKKLLCKFDPKTFINSNYYKDKISKAAYPEKKNKIYTDPKFLNVDIKEFKDTDTLTSYEHMILSGYLPLYEIKCNKSDCYFRTKNLGIKPIFDYQKDQLFYLQEAVRDKYRYKYYLNDNNKKNINIIKTTGDIDFTSAKNYPGISQFEHIGDGLIYLLENDEELKKIKDLNNEALDTNKFYLREQRKKRQEEAIQNGPFKGKKVKGYSDYFINSLDLLSGRDPKSTLRKIRGLDKIKKKEEKFKTLDEKLNDELAEAKGYKWTYETDPPSGYKTQFNPLPDILDRLDDINIEYNDDHVIEKLKSYAANLALTKYGIDGKENLIKDIDNDEIFLKNKRIPHYYVLKNPTNAAIKELSSRRNLANIAGLNIPRMEPMIQDVDNFI